MQTTATVIEIRGDKAIVEVERQAACDGCHKNKDGGGCSICTLTGASRKFTATAYNKVGAEIGDRVKVDTASERVLGYAALVFLLPIVAGFVFYFLATKITEIELYHYVSLVLGFVISFFFIWLYAKRVGKTRCDLEIVEISEKSNEGQN